MKYQVGLKEILYRAYDIRKNSMVYNALLLTEVQRLATIDESFNSPFSFFDGCIWLLCTGEKDSADKLIYDGDIVIKGSLDNLRMVVKYGKYEYSPDSECAVQYHIGFYLIGINGFILPIEYNDSQNLSVIGNIYENPELVRIQ